MAEPSPRRRSGYLAETVLQLLRVSRVPLAGIEIAERLRASDPRVSNSQVFRTLLKLRRDRGIRKIEHRNGYAAGGDDRCVSLVCGKCGALRTLEAPDFFEAIDAAARQRGFRPSRYIVELPGICEACQDATVE